MKRRKFLSLSAKTGAATLVAALAPVALAYGCRVLRKQITLAGLPGVFDGFRIALISDLHHSAWIPQDYIRSVVALTNAEKPDLVALTGDLIHRGRQWVPGCMAELAKLRARHGVVAVLGNHDHHDGAAPLLRRALATAGVADLTNANTTLRRDGHPLVIGGVGDLWRERQKLHRALTGARGAESMVLLSHNPDFTEHITDERVGIVLSGHTHGGQVVFPWLGAPIVPSRYGQKYLSGLCQGPLARVFVTRGAGSSFPPLRFRCPPEVPILMLRSGKRRLA